MNFIVTPAGIRDMVYDTTFQETVDGNSLIFVLYEPDDIVRVADIALLMDSKASISYICAPNRDDKLLCIGAIKIRMNCMIFDKELNVETTYFDIIEQMCNVISSDTSKSEKKIPVVNAENVKQVIETSENVEDVVTSSEDNHDEDGNAENQESVSDTESDNPDSTENINTEEEQDLSSENMNADESDVSDNDESDNTDFSDEGSTQEFESNSDESDVNNDVFESNDDTSSETESDEDAEDREDTESDDDVSESFGAAPDDVEEPDVDSMLEEKEHGGVGNAVGETFESSHEDKESTMEEELTEGLLPEGTKKHPFDTRNSNGLNDRQQAMYNIVRMFPKVTKMTIGEYMDAIISIVTLTDDESLVESKIRELESGPIIWNRIKNCLDDIREIAK